MSSFKRAPARRQFLCGCCASFGSAAFLLKTMAGSPDILPLELAPYHVLPFDNQYARFIVSRIPPGKVGSWHRHLRDFAFVYVQAPLIEVAVLGKDPVRTTRKVGEVVFANYSKQPIAHQIANIGDHDFHIMGIELLDGPPSRFTPQDRPPPYIKVTENDRIVGWRLVLEPQQSAPSITQAAPAARFVIRPGIFSEVYPEKTRHELNLSQGDFAWIDPGVSRAIENLGNSTIEFVEFEIK
ncbi:hypothetical protein [Methylobacterium tarhaniae]|uniref:hypothetical protein n=1 Tax=Methylobacterium tarhaniae TaxID=1187852 RepID=UPI003CFC27AA